MAGKSARPLEKELPPLTLGAAFRDIVTGPDGQTIAIGRILGLQLFFFGLGAPTAIAVTKLISETTSMQDWVNYITALSVYIPTLMGGVVLLIAGSNFTEPPDPDRIRALIPGGGGGMSWSQSSGYVAPPGGVPGGPVIPDPAPRLGE